MVHNRTRKYQTAIVAVVAMVAGSAGAGCRQYGGAAPQSEAIPAAGRGMTAVQIHTRTAQHHVQEAIPHADPTGQVHLYEATAEHEAVLDGAAQVEHGLAQAHEELATAQEAVHQEQNARQKLEGEWYVTWGRRIERIFWTLAVTWLIGSILSVLLGMGSPISWLGRLRTLFAARQATSWIGNTFAPKGV